MQINFFERCIWPPYLAPPPLPLAVFPPEILAFFSLKKRNYLNGQFCIFSPLSCAKKGGGEIFYFPWSIHNRLDINRRVRGGFPCDLWPQWVKSSTVDTVGPVPHRLYSPCALTIQWHSCLYCMYLACIHCTLYSVQRYISTRSLFLWHSKQTETYVHFVQ